MFKKSMAALAVLSLSAGLASASEVTLYGIVDNGLLYKHSKVETNGVSTKTDSFGLESGISSPSRFGIKGSEDLGNGMTVSFKLENGFNADDGDNGYFRFHEFFLFLKQFQKQYHVSTDTGKKQRGISPLQKNPDEFSISASIRRWKPPAPSCRSVGFPAY